MILGNQLDNRANRGVSDFDRTHRFVLSYLWDLPRPAFAKRSAAGRLLFSNWQVAGIITAMSGLPIDIVDGARVRSMLTGQITLRAAKLGARSNTQHRDQQHSGWVFLQPSRVCPADRSGWPSDSQFKRTAAGATGTDFGNVGRNVLRGPAD